MLSVVSSDPEALNASFSGLRGKVTKWGPCACPPCREENVPDMSEHAQLIRRQRDGKRASECRKSSHDVSVSELLDEGRL